MPHENLRHLQSKPVFETSAEVPLTKCPAHPTKRMWTDPIQAIREAETRSEIAPVPIAAYRCDACGNAHLCKRSAVRPGSLLEHPEVERNWEVFPAKPGNSAAIQKMLAALLEGRTEIASSEVIQKLELSRPTMRKHMEAAGWKSGSGRTAKWTPKATTLAAVTPIQEPVNIELEASIARHPASQINPWSEFGMDRVRHIPLGDLIDTLAAAGVELRIQTRSKK